MEIIQRMSLGGSEVLALKSRPVLTRSWDQVVREIASTNELMAVAVRADFVLGKPYWHLFIVPNLTLGCVVCLVWFFFWFFFFFFFFLVAKALALVFGRPELIYYLCANVDPKRNWDTFPWRHWFISLMDLADGDVIFKSLLDMAGKTDKLSCLWNEVADRKVHEEMLFMNRVCIDVKRIPESELPGAPSIRAAALELIKANPDVTINFKKGVFQVNFDMVKRFCPDMFGPVEMTEKFQKRSKASPYQCSTFPSKYYALI
jgi:hypothetical protein